MTTTEAPAPDTTEEAIAGPYKAENTDAFTQSTRRCTRRAWDVFLKVRNNVDKFNSQLVRARIEADSEAAAQEMYETLKAETELQQGTVLGDRIECTTTLAAIQLIIKRPDFKMLDAVAIF